jgi:hypothetical protein
VPISGAGMAGLAGEVASWGGWTGDGETSSVPGEIATGAATRALTEPLLNHSHTPSTISALTNSTPASPRMIVRDRMTRSRRHRVRHLRHLGQNLPDDVVGGDAFRLGLKVEN